MLSKWKRIFVHTIIALLQLPSSGSGHLSLVSALPGLLLVYYTWLHTQPLPARDSDTRMSCSSYMKYSFLPVPSRQEGELTMKMWNDTLTFLDNAELVPRIKRKSQGCQAHALSHCIVLQQAKLAQNSGHSFL